MNYTAIFIDLENVRVRAGKLHPPKDIFDDDFIPKLKKRLEVEGCNITQIIAYDNYENGYFSKNDGLKNFSAWGVIPKHALYSEGVKNSADLELSVDALEIAIKNNVETIVLVSSDKDMFPLIKKLKAYSKKVILSGVTFNTSPFVIKYVDKFIPVESILETSYDENYILKHDIILAVKRIKDLYDWSQEKSSDLGKDFCLKKIKQTIFETNEYVEYIFEKLKENNIVEEYIYSHKQAQYIGVKFLHNETSRKILGGEIPGFY